MTKCVCYVQPDQIPAKIPSEEVHILLYGGRPVHRGTVAIGAQFRDLYKRLGVQPSNIAIDLVSIALAVTAADTFVRRADAATSWEREINIEMPLSAPGVWAPVLPQLERMLAFLSCDRWRFKFKGSGEAAPPTNIIRRLKKRVDFSNADSVTLFSGGIDSTIWTVEMLQKGFSPILVSHASRGDAKVQNRIAARLPKKAERVAVNAWPTSSLKSDVSMRTRSFLFIAIGVLVCDAWSAYHEKEPPKLFIPENGFIAVNAPLTPRRIGSHSTRTTHPYFLEMMRQMLEAVKLPSRIHNPFELKTKGEIISSIRGDATSESLVPYTVSCSKWKRRNIQCGRCFSCLVRRAALHAGNVDDETKYLIEDLSDLIPQRNEKRDDLIALMTAVRRLQTDKLERWVSRSGRLPSDMIQRKNLVDVFRRGLEESANFLRNQNLMK